jgi:hypothetical protein
MMGEREERERRKGREAREEKLENQRESANMRSETKKELATERRKWMSIDIEKCHNRN